MLRKHYAPDSKIEAKEGHRRRLCSNNVGARCPSLEFNPNHEMVTDSMALDYLANLVARIVLNYQKNASHNTSKRK